MEPIAMSALRIAALLVLLCAAAPPSEVLGGASNSSVVFPGAAPAPALAPDEAAAQAEGRSLGVAEGKNVLLDWIGLGTGPETDPYLARANAACLNGDLAECFKSRALNSLDFLELPAYPLTENARIVRMADTHLRSLQHEPYEFSSAPRADESEWDQLVKFALRKVEKFLKSTAIEVQFPNEVTENGRYSPRFIDEIASELDIIEDKKRTPFSRKRLKKLFIPLLIILKLFKLKLLLFLPLILGLASFKKLLGFLAIVIPGLIGFFKFCKPNLTQGFGGGYGQSPYYQTRPHPYVPHPSPPLHHSGGDSYYGVPYSRDSEPQTSSSVSFHEHEPSSGYSSAHDLAYQGYSHYRNAGGASDEDVNSASS
ncbi:uncharacterized protein LOC126355745 isoform X3 [Schistocerca gregaria]|uniref:uncharacterized protein LOC126355745 isoform X3 n=2 Tax=Schistocerca gregaria TaxID=7010 RepID=UPI00211EF6F2|nr:uncharacterized protein LOC126355745 isoform X3 [Schistocerca gregaria]